MLRFYLGLLRDIPSVARSTAETVTFWLMGVAMPIVLLIRPGLAQVGDDPVVIRQVSVAVLAVAILQAVARANYTKYRDSQKRAEVAESAALSERARSARQTALGNLAGEFVLLMRACVECKVPEDGLRAQLEQLTDRAVEFVRQHFNGGEAILLIDYETPKPDGNATALMKDGAGEEAVIYMLAQQRSTAIRKLIVASRSPIDPVRTAQ